MKTLYIGQNVVFRTKHAPSVGVHMPTSIEDATGALRQGTITGLVEDPLLGVGVNPTGEPNVCYGLNPRDVLGL